MSKEKKKTFGVEDLAKLAGIETASARVLLRKAGVKRSGKVYEFKSKDEMQKIIDKSRSGDSKKKPEPKKAPAKKKK